MQKSLSAQPPLKRIARALVPAEAIDLMAKRAKGTDRVVRFYATSTRIPASELVSAARSFAPDALSHDHLTSDGQQVRISLEKRVRAKRIVIGVVVHRGIKVQPFGPPRSEEARKIVKALRARSTTVRRKSVDAA